MWTSVILYKDAGHDLHLDLKRHSVAVRTFY